MSELTIAIPYYRGRDYLRDAVRSVLVQDAAPESWRLLIVDDGERGEARAVLRELDLEPDPSGDARVRCIENDRNLGMVGNWNRCLAEAATPLVTLLHADDQLEPNYVSTQLRLAEVAPDAAAYFCAARIIDARGAEVFSFADWIKRFFVPPRARDADEFELRGEAALGALMAGNFIMCPTLCFRLAKLGERRFDDRWKQVQDLEFTARLLMDGELLVGSQTIGYAYRRHAEGATAQQSESGVRFHEELELFESIAARARELGWTNAAATAQRKSIVRLHLLYQAIGSAVRGRFGRAAQLVGLAARGKPGDSAPD